VVLVEVLEQAGTGRLSSEQLPGQGRGGGAVHGDEVAQVGELFDGLVGGIRTPQVAAPIAVVNGTGDTSSAGGGFCKLFGTTVPFTAAKLAQLYPTHHAFVKKWNQAVASAVAKGYLLTADAKPLDKVAAQSTVGG
jgi:hypothetical protein